MAESARGIATAGSHYAQTCDKTIAKVCEIGSTARPEKGKEEKKVSTLGDKTKATAPGKSVYDSMLVLLDKELAFFDS